MKTAILTLFVTLGSFGLVFSTSPTTTLEPPTCFIAPVVDLESIVCDDNGTPYDNSDDTYIVNIEITSANDEPGATGTFSDDQGNIFNYSDSPEMLSYGPFSASDIVTITYTDTDELENCDATVIITPPNCPVAVCSITPQAPTVVCDDNGTPYDPSDDTFTFDITVDGENTEASASNTFNDDQGNVGIAYGTTLSYGPFPISGGSVVVTYTDVDAPANVGCTAMMTGIPPDPCSPAECNITPQAATDIVCDDNGTEFDPSDDTFTFTVTVDGENTEASASNTFNDDQGNVGIAYGTTLFYGPFPISGGPVTITYTDVDAPADLEPPCVATITAMPPPDCSIAECDINPEAAIVSDCDDNGTPFDPSDDTFTFTITVNGENTETSASNTFNDDQGNTGIAYGTTLNYGPFLISGGPIIVTYTDVDAPADLEPPCVAMMMAVPPASCSNAVCSITPGAPDVTCDDNGTEFDNSDDTYTFDITVGGSNTAPGASNTFDDDQGNSGIAYGSTVSYGPFPISGGSITVTYTDVDAPVDSCTATMTGIPPEPCSVAMCDITPQTATDIVCDNNGTEFDPSDDTFTFTVTVDGSNTASDASNTFNDDQGNMGIAYGTTLTYGPFLIDDGPIVVTYTDVDYPDECPIGTAVADPPEPCSVAMCDITPQTATVSACDDNGTPFDPSDDTFTFTITVNGSNTATTASNTFNDDQGNTEPYGTTVSYGPFPISGGPIVVTYTDVDAPADLVPPCEAMMMAVPPDACEPPVCMVDPQTAADIVCDDNGTPFDPSDDTFTFTVTVDGSNTAPGASNTFDDDQGNMGVAYGTTVSYGPYPISGGPVTVTYTDADYPSDCPIGIVTAIQPDPCPVVCMIEPVVTDIDCDDNGTPDDRSDDIYTFDVIVNGDNGDPSASDTFNDDQGNSGAYGTTLTYGPFPISGGDITIVYTDVDLPGCTAMVTADAPAVCSFEGVPTVGEWGLIILGLLMSITAVVGIRQRREEEVYS